ncbi:MAG: acyl-protein synthetase [Sandaracinaceae bacterium]|nr:acyl-protein synthetase [Sandaracinaceae bacterium]
MLAPSDLASHPERARLRTAILALLERAEARPHASFEAERDAILSEVAALQAEHVTPFGRLCAARGARFDHGPDGWPALPTDVYRHTRVSLAAPGADRCVFRTSGTTHGARGEHPFVELALYHRASMIGARLALLPEVPFDLLVIAADPARQPDSSLGHMLGLFADEARGRDPDAHVAFVLEGDHIDTSAAARAIEHASSRGRALVLAGTSFAFVFGEDVWDRRFVLPADSRVMFTGGYKGRSRVLDEASLRAAIVARYGVREDHVLMEYGMTELCSPLWGRERIDRGSPTSQGVLWIPPWLRVTAVDPVSLAPVAEGERGLLRFDDPACLDSCVSIQTADHGVITRLADGTRGLRLLGRDPSAVPRGCSLAIEEALTPR